MTIRSTRSATLPCLVALTLATGPILAATGTRAPEAQSPASVACEPGKRAVAIPGLPEASGLALSRRVPGRLWTHHDSGKPAVHALDSNGKVTATVQVTGATVEDWEAIAVGPCPAGSCLYVGDIGDNDAARRQITIYRVPEPQASDRTAAVADVLHATYPDGPQDAETLLVAPDGNVFIVTKGETRAVALYRFPKELRPGQAHALERVGKPNGSGKAAADGRITDGAISPDGTWTVLRTGQRLTFHRSDELLTGNWRAAATVDLTSIGEAQGEGVALAADHAVFLAGEGGGKARPGTFARLSCALK